jgi:putative ABC transport system substrate-binding protein
MSAFVPKRPNWQGQTCRLGRDILLHIAQGIVPAGTGRMAIGIGRRQFISALGGTAATWPLAARAQQAASIPAIGWLSGRSSETDALVLPAFHRGLNEQGFAEGRNVTIEYRWAEGRYDRIPALVADFVLRSVNIIVVAGVDERSYLTVQAATSSIPIVFLTASNPVKIGLVPNFNHPGGNITGITSLFVEIGQKRLGLLHELLPHANAFAALSNPANSASITELADMQEAGRGLGLQIKTLVASNDHDLGAAFASLAQMRPDALFLVSDPFLFSHANQIVASAAHSVVPTLYFRREFAIAGGLMSYGTNTDENYHAAGDYAGRILKGEKPGDLPILQPTKYELVINLKTAKALGLTIPPTLLARADEVIE